LQFLTKLVQRDQKIGEKERDITEQFVKRFNILKKQYAIQEPDLKIEPAGITKPEVPLVSMQETIMTPVMVEKPEMAVTMPVPEAVVPDRPVIHQLETVEISSIEDLKSAIENLRAKLDSANSRLVKVVQLLGSRPKLKPVAEKLEKIVELYTSCANQTKTLETFLLTNSDAFVQSVLKDYEFIKPTHLSGEQMPPGKFELSVESAKSLKSEEKHEPLSEVLAGSIQIKEVNLFLCQGKYFAIPADQIVKFDQISSTKAAALTSRGIGTLKDVKPFFKSIKHGVKGVWREKSDKELKSMVFKYVDFRRKFNLPVYRGEYGGIVVFASSLNHHVMFIVDSVIGEGSFPVIEIKSVKRPGVMAIANLDQYKNVDVIDIAGL
ncbi:MAG: hypothetical protein QXM93_08355, partial [Candidatus Methanomethyliaceae archaeon]